MRPFRLLVFLLAALLAACTTASPAVRQEPVLPNDEALTGHGEWSSPTGADLALQEVQWVSSGGKPPRPSGTRGLPLTLKRLFALAHGRNIGLSPNPVQRNREVGMAFQQKTGFADVPTSFTLTTRPRVLKLR